ncbi:XPG/RAD2 endonuclease [Penicillium hetheringtonii]|uniref:XPG/RAD2 endonuclease n=1 Tax=Penicillium hetheringtonii TaxID=911720 RepID=A0AAD6DRF6_9EURO|nr:XPG/RAD2 endonuclease [Penicillium hetheringtonii]
MPTLHLSSGGVPDLNGLRQFLMATIGWSPERTDEVLVPVIRDMNRREQEGTQSNITQFMAGPQGAGAFAPRVRGSGPSRMEKAFGRLRQEAETLTGRNPKGGNTQDAENVEETDTAATKQGKRGRTNQSPGGRKKGKTRGG